MFAISLDRPQIGYGNSLPSGYHITRKCVMRLFQNLKGVTHLNEYNALQMQLYEWSVSA